MSGNRSLTGGGGPEGRWWSIGLGAIPFVGAIAGWEVLTILDFEGLRYVLPSPMSVVQALYEDLSTGEVWRHTAITMQEVFWGMLIAVAGALVIGITIGRSRLLERMAFTTRAQSASGIILHLRRPVFHLARPRPRHQLPALPLVGANRR